MTSSPATTATFCATLVDEWARLGVRHAVVSPGSRSTPMALAIGSCSSISLHVFHDERSASFAALGIALETQMPAILLCTSGTAAVEFHAAAVEAHHAEVPMLLCTADRPPELQGVGASQTIDQQNLYGVASRLFVDAGVADDLKSDTWRALARECLEKACGLSPGPVQINLPFREPLIGDANELPPVLDARPIVRSAASMPSELEIQVVISELRNVRGVILAGSGSPSFDSVARLASVLDWPIIADPRSGCRVDGRLDGHDDVVIVGAADSILRCGGFAANNAPDVVLRLGEPPVSKVVNAWLRESAALYIAVSATPRVIDPDRIVTRHVVAPIGKWCEAVADSVENSLKKSLENSVTTPSDESDSWLASWRQGQASAESAIAGVLSNSEVLSEPSVARLLSQCAQQGSRVVLSSSMPVRDYEWFASPTSGIGVYCNRGVSGIDGVVSTAVGVALASGETTYLLIGDVAMLHDANGLIALSRREVDLRIICVDNNGGGIFSFLPQATSLDPSRFEQLFGTPHDSDLKALAEAHGIASTTADTPAELRKAISLRGPQFVRVATDRRANVLAHDQINEAVATALKNG